MGGCMESYLEISKKYRKKAMADKRLSRDAKLWIEFFRKQVKLDGSYTVTDLEVLAELLKECAKEMKNADQWKVVMKLITKILNWLCRHNIHLLWKYTKYRHYNWSYIVIRTRKCRWCEKVQRHNPQLENRWVDGEDIIIMDKKGNEIERRGIYAKGQWVGIEMAGNKTGQMHEEAKSYCRIVEICRKLNMPVQLGISTCDSVINFIIELYLSNAGLKASKAGIDLRNKLLGSHK